MRLTRALLAVATAITLSAGLGLARADMQCAGDHDDYTPSASDTGVKGYLQFGKPTLHVKRDQPVMTWVAWKICFYERPGD